VALDGVVLIGHDWGEALALDWAARHPRRVRGIGRRHFSAAWHLITQHFRGGQPFGHAPCLGQGWPELDRAGARAGPWRMGGGAHPGAGLWLEIRQLARSGLVTRWADLRPSRRLCLRAAPRLRPAGQAVIRRSDLTAIWLPCPVMLVFVILVGQGVLGRSADRRPGWPFQDAEECDAPARIGGRRSSRLDRPPMAAMPSEREFDTKAQCLSWLSPRPTSPSWCGTERALVAAAFMSGWR
jgi:pimeloyl-ACP methyl ester carboxylesterase